MEADQLADNWEDLLDDSQPEPVVYFGSTSTITPIKQPTTSAPAYRLYEAYEIYFGLLLENILLMRGEPEVAAPSFPNFLTSIQEYVSAQVFTGQSDYNSYLNFLNQLYDKNPECKTLYLQLLATFQQPPLPFYIQSKNSLGDNKNKKLNTSIKSVAIEDDCPISKKDIKQQKIEEIMAEHTGKPLLSKPAINVAIIGHVDHGKSTLLGSILLKQPHTLTATNESLPTDGKLNAFTDIYEAEKQKGKTLEFAKYTLESLVPKHRINIFDTPGHRNYAANMVLALRVADVALVVVSARSGQFQSALQGGTLKELLLLASGFGIQRIGVVFNKMQSVKFNKNVFSQMKQTLKPYLKTFKTVDFLPYDALLGRNYQGPRIYQDSPTLLEWFESLPPTSSELVNGPLRMPIFDVQTRSGMRYIYGKVESGFIYKGMPVCIYPNSANPESDPLTIPITSVYREDDEIPYALAGDFVAVIIRGANAPERGQIIANQKNSSFQGPLVCQQMICDITCLTALLISGTQCMLHLHEIVTDVEVQVLGIGTEGEISGKYLKQGQEGIVKIKIREGKVAVEKKGSSGVWRLGCLALRSGLVTLAVGGVKKVRRSKK